jgi:lipid II:glycine glycyltransferase (peptidoglycan interpeptide bridge formation enzyme)
MTTLKQCRDRQEWDDYILEHGGHPLQLWGWGELKSAHGWSAYRIYSHDGGGHITGAAQMLVKKLPWPMGSFAYVPRGPVADKDNREVLLNSLAKYARKTHKAVVLAVEPDCEVFDIPQGWKKSQNRILPARTIILDLMKSESDLMGDMSKKTRQYIRKSGGEAITIKKVRNREELEECMEIYRQTAHRAKFNLHRDNYYYDLFDMMGEYSPVFASYVDGKPIAFLWLAISADTAFELYGGMNDMGQQLRANYALKWHAIRKCKEWGLKGYDFGGLIDEGGIVQFKKGWKDEETMLAGTFDRPLSVLYIVWSSLLPYAKKIIRKVVSIIKR